MAAAAGRLLLFSKRALCRMKDLNPHRRTLSTVSTHAKSQFEEDGVVCIRNAIPEEFVESLRQACEKNMKVAFLLSSLFKPTSHVAPYTPREERLGIDDDARRVSGFGHSLSKVGVKTWQELNGISLCLTEASVPLSLMSCAAPIKSRSVRVGERGGGWQCNPGPLCDEHSAAAGSAGRFHDDQFLWRRHDECRAYLFNSPVAKIAAQIMGSTSVNILCVLPNQLPLFPPPSMRYSLTTLTDSRLYCIDACLLCVGFVVVVVVCVYIVGLPDDHLLVKEPGTVAPTPWHNDYSYWQIRGNDICSIWLALDKVKRENMVTYVRGSHRWKMLHKITNFSGEDSDDGRYAQSPNQEEIPLEAIHRGEYELLGWDMEPGDIVVHHGWTLHGATGNTDLKTMRRGYATRWLGDDITFDPRPGTMHFKWAENGYDCGLQPA
eukprot:jgi/Bigna1/90024/estExt_fgenesh1_pg.C_600085